MNFFSGLVNNIRDINTATKTGAVDVVFVEQETGEYVSTPFHVRFGKIGVVWSSDKLIDVEINGREVDLHMKLSHDGRAYFVSETVDADDEVCKDNVSLEESINEDSNISHRRTRHHSDSDVSDLPEALENELRAGAKAVSNPNLEEVVDMVMETQRKTTLSLSRDDLDRLNLRSGSNEVIFSITTQFQGTTTCSCSVFVWSHEDKVVISDIDGTITKSDVRGMILPLIGVHDWAQGRVTSLFSRIHNNGYKILYLSARSISQAAETKSYLQSLNQGDCLPPGPLFLNPESALRSFKREVIDKKPEIFKVKLIKLHSSHCNL